MHRCIGNDDLENQKIYEQSVRPEGIRKTLQIKDSVYTLERKDVYHSSKIMKDNTNRKVVYKKGKKEIASIIAIVCTILSIIFSIIEAILG